MKHRLTYILILISLMIVIAGHFIDIYWIGIATWSIATVLLAIALYFTKYIREDDSKKNP